MSNFFQQLQQKASQTYGNVDKNMFRGYLPGGASREASSAVPQVSYSPGDIADKGLIPVPTVIPAVEGGAKFVKSMAGPLGMPFRVEPAIIGREKLLQDQVDRGTRSGDKVTYGLHDKGYQAPSGLKQQLERGIVGQFEGTVKDNGDVVMREGEGYQKYDTNYTPQQHAEVANKAWDKGDIGGSLMSRVYQGYSALQDRGWTNTAPQGTSEQLLGKVDNPNAQNPAPTRKAAQADITVAGTAEPGPSMNYAVKAKETLSAIASGLGMNFGGKSERPNQPATKPEPSRKPNYTPNSPMTTKSTAPASVPAAASYSVQAGDTLTSIARKRGVSIAEIARKNNIQNIDQIGIGQKLNF